MSQGRLLVYHDRATGGLLVTLAEMAFAGHYGIDANIGLLGEDTLGALFNKQLRAVIQIDMTDRDTVTALFHQESLAKCLHYLGTTLSGDRFLLRAGERSLYSESSLPL